MLLYLGCFNISDQATKLDQNDDIEAYLVTFERAMAASEIPVGRYKVCVDFRRLNSLTALDAYPMPCIEELIDNLGGTTYLTTLDLAWGYWQVPMAENAKENAREKTAFVTPHSLFQFEVMPSGLNRAQATF